MRDAPEIPDPRRSAARGPMAAAVRRSALSVLLGLAFFGTLFALGVLGQFGVPQVVLQTESGPLPMLFLDWRVLLSAFDCHRLGVDVYVTNGCDPLGRTHVYPPLWLELSRTGLSQADLFWSAPLLIIGYLAACGWQLERDDALAWSMALLVICSPALAFAFERANVDLMIYLLVALAVAGYASRDPRAGWVGDLLLAIAILLKIYPLALFPLVVCHAAVQGWRHLVVRLALMAVVVLGYSWWSLDATVRVLLEAPMHIAPEAFGARLLTRLFDWNGLGWPHARAFHALLYLALVAACYRFVGGVRWAEAGSTRTRWLLVAGTLVLAFCYVAGTSLDYRLAFVSLLVPHLACLLRGSEARWVRALAGSCLGLLLISCWLLWPLDHLVERAPGHAVFILPETSELMIGLWAAKQLALLIALVPLGAIAARIMVAALRTPLSGARRTP